MNRCLPFQALLLLLLSAVLACRMNLPTLSCHKDQDCVGGSHCDTEWNVCVIDLADAAAAGPDAAVDAGVCLDGHACSIGALSGLCKGGACAACAGSADNVACSQAYGGAFVCVSGSCVKGSCSSDGDCSPGQICGLASPNVCGVCQADDQCLADPTYGAGHLCAEGKCVAGDCHLSGSCPAGQLCKANACGSCVANVECRKDPAYGAGFVCSKNACVRGDCLTTKDCAAGELCGAVVGSPNLCAGCSSDGRCQADQAYGAKYICVGGDCVVGNCHADFDCAASLGICKSETHSCSPCGADSDCWADPFYGKSTICEGGDCILGNCHGWADCAGQLCPAHQCVPCDQPRSCDPYGAGYVCDNGVCLKGSCAKDQDCAPGQICSEYLTCTRCQADGECIFDSTYGTGYICVFYACVKGDCHAQGECSDGEICGIDPTHPHSCAPCSATADCTLALGPVHVCSGGKCVDGDCLSSADCLNGRICSKNHCIDCQGDLECQADQTYFQKWGAEIVCVQGGCEPGNCHADRDCLPPGQICGLDQANPNTCAPCGGDRECQDDPAYGLGHLCIKGQCVVADCRLNGDCAGRLCSSNVCTDCSDSNCATEPPAGYGSGYVCVGGICVQGSCAKDGDCAQGQICDTTHACAPCKVDPDCQNDPGYGSGTLCILGLCTPADCRDSAVCDVRRAGQICGGNGSHHCGVCGKSADCQQDGYYFAKFGQTVCAGGACVAGNCNISSECQPGDLCLSNQCSVCATDLQCLSDPLYGSGFLCIAGGGCAPADCHDDSNCKGQICGLQAPNHCAACQSDPQCQSDPAFGPNTICQIADGTCVSNACAVTASACGANPGDVCCSATGGPTCVRGNCCIDVDCSIRGTGFKCLKNNCTGCSPGAGTTLFVDPVYGSDSTGVGVNSYGCAFKTITRALQASGNLPSVTIAVLPTGAVGAKSTETFPIMPRPNATITGSGGQVTVLVPASTTGFALDSPSVSLQQMVVDGQAQTAVSGVRVASSAILKDLTVRSFASDGILLTGGDLILGGLFSTIDNGTKAQRASGVRITGGQLKVNLPSIGQGTVRLEHNQADGIHVTDFGSVQIQGKATSSTTGSVLLNSNQGSGLYIEQVGKTANLPCSVAGLVASSNQIDGIQVFGGSSLTLRQSVLLGNGNAGVEVKTAVVGSTRTNDISEIDLGKDPSNPGQTWGQNTLQGSAGESPNVGAGICLKIDLAAGQVLSAMGNIFTNAIDCSANKPGMILKRSDSCTNAADLSIYVSPPMAPTTNGMEVKNCH